MTLITKSPFRLLLYIPHILSIGINLLDFQQLSQKTLFIEEKKTMEQMKFSNRWKADYRRMSKICVHLG